MYIYTNAKFNTKLCCVSQMMDIYYINLYYLCETINFNINKKNCIFIGFMISNLIGTYLSESSTHGIFASRNTFGQVDMFSYNNCVLWNMDGSSSTYICIR